MELNHHRKLVQRGDCRHFPSHLLGNDICTVLTEQYESAPLVHWWGQISRYGRRLLLSP